jgi:hypothetical protein
MSPLSLLKARRADLFAPTAPSMSTPSLKRASDTSVPPSSSPLLSTTLSLVLLQLVSRLFSFSLNQLLLRSTTPQALGVATMGFEVVRDTGLFLVREGMRGAVVVSCFISSLGLRAVAYLHLHSSVPVHLPRMAYHLAYPEPSSSPPTSPRSLSSSSASTPSSPPRLFQPSSTRHYPSMPCPPSSSS